MRLPHLSLSADTLLDTYGLYHLTQLQADPALTDLATAFRQAQERLHGRNQEHRRAQAASLVATAVRDRKDLALDEAIMRFNHAVLEYVRKDRRSPLYVKYFSDGLRSVTEAPLSSETRRVRTLLAKLAEETVETSKSHVQPITIALEELEAATAAQQHALDTEGQAFRVLQSEKIAWLDVYRQDHNKLQIHFHDCPRRGRREAEVGEQTHVTQPIAEPIVADRARAETGQQVVDQREVSRARGVGGRRGVAAAAPFESVAFERSGGSTRTATAYCPGISPHPLPYGRSSSAPIGNPACSSGQGRPAIDGHAEPTATPRPRIASRTASAAA